MQSFGLCGVCREPYHIEHGGSRRFLFCGGKDCLKYRPDPAPPRPTIDGRKSTYEHAHGTSTAYGRGCRCAVCVFAARQRTLFNKYGDNDVTRRALTPGNYCEICEDVVTDKTAAVDHDHRCCSGKGKTCGSCARGLLCKGCNAGIGLLRDSAKIAAAAAAYLTKHGAL